MDYQRYIEMIDIYLEEPNSINREWVELLREARRMFKKKYNLLSAYKDIFDSEKAEERECIKAVKARK